MSILYIILHSTEFPYHNIWTILLLSSREQFMQRATFVEVGYFMRILYRNRFHIIGIETYRAVHIMIYTDRRKIHVPVGRRPFPDHIVCFYIIIYIYCTLLRGRYATTTTAALRGATGSDVIFNESPFHLREKFRPNKNALSLSLSIYIYI